MHPGLSAKCNVVWKSQRNYSATSETKPVSSRITRAFQTTLTALTEPGTLSQLITHYLSLSIYTSIALCPECCAIYTPTEWHMCYTLCRGSSYAGAVYPMPSISNGSNLLEQFRVRVGTGTEPLQQFYHMKNLDGCIWASFHLKAWPLQAEIFGSN
jgi:hypothetical protein